MKRRTTAFAVALLVAALVMTGCNPSASSGGGDGSAASVMRAMSQAVESVGVDSTVSASGNTITVTQFVADDGTKISGTITKDESGNIVGAELTLINADGSAGPVLVLKTESGTQDITYGDDPVSSGNVPQPMNREQRIAFGGLLIGFDEAFDEIEDILDDILDDDGYSPGTHPIPDIFGNSIQGTFTVERERDDDDYETEVTAVDITHFEIPITRSGTVSGSYSFAKRGDDDIRSDVDITIRGFRESDDGLEIELSDISVKAEMEESEIWDEDTFRFSGSISGKYSLNGTAHEISFSGEMSAMDDRYFSFPDYSLTIDGENVAIGRYEKPYNR